MRRQGIPGTPRRFLGVNVETTVLRCSGCGQGALHVEVWEGDDPPDGLPLELELCECGGFLFPVPPSMGGDAPE